jgi:hypothetical protein
MSHISRCDAPPLRKKRIVDLALPGPDEPDDAIAGPVAPPLSPRADTLAAALRKTLRE